MPLPEPSTGGSSVDPPASADASDQAPARKGARPARPVPDDAAMDLVWTGGMAIYHLDRDRVVLTWNPAAERLWGIAAQDAIGRPIDDLVDWQVVSGPGRALDELPITTRAWTERTIDRPKVGSRVGERLVVDLDVTAERNATGPIERYVVFSRDVTRSAELAGEMAPLGTVATAGGTVRDRQAVARLALEVLRRATGADDGIVAVVRDGGFETLAELNEGRFAQALAAVDPATSTLFAAIGRPGVVISGDSRTLPLQDDLRAALLRVGLHWLVSTAIRRGDAIIGLVAVGWTRDLPEDPAETPVLSAAAALGAALENARLVEELSERFDAAAASEQRYRTIFDDAPEAYVVTTVDGVITDMNPRAGRLYRTVPGGLVGRHVSELAEMDAAEYERRNDAVRSDAQGVFGGTGRRVDGTTFPQEMTVRRIVLDGETHHLVNIRDMTEPDRLAAELLQAQKMEAVGQLVAGVAHELNNPLQAIIGFSKLLGMDPEMPEQLRADAGLLVGEAVRTKRIVENLLDFARQRPPERHPTRLALLVRSVLDLQSYQFSGGAVTVTLDVPDDLPLVALDRAQIQQVVLNLTQNAFQAIMADRGRGTIRIAAEATRDQAGAAVVRLRVEDDGPGVPAALQPRLFLPFFSTKEPGEGTGLGLSVSFGIVTGHGGRLWYEPSRDRGAVFIVELPLLPGGEHDPVDRESAVLPAGMAVELTPRRPSERHPAAGATMAASSPVTAADQPRLRILVLDDEPMIRDFLRRVLRPLADVVIAESGAEALRLVEGGPFDAMLCDHRMPGMSGMEVFDGVARLRPELAGRFVLMSGDVLNPDLGRFSEGRSGRLLAKPFEIETLQAVVAEIAAEVAAGRS